MIAPKWNTAGLSIVSPASAASKREERMEAIFRTFAATKSPKTRPETATMNGRYLRIPDRISGSWARVKRREIAKYRT